MTEPDWRAALGRIQAIPDPSGPAAIAEVFAGTPDVLRPLIEATVGGLVSAVTGYLAARADAITADVAAAITTALQAAAAQALADATPGIAAEPAPPAAVMDRSESLAKARAAQAAAEQRTCIICGRVGTRRFTSTGDERWVCSPTAAACPGNKYCKCKTGPMADCPIHNGEAPTVPLSAITSAATVTATVGPAPEPTGAKPAVVESIPEQAQAPVPPAAAGVTARCRDCTRTWTLTGRVIDQAIAMHEIKHGHIVTNHEIARS